MIWLFTLLISFLTSPLLAFPLSPNPHHLTNILTKRYTIDCFEQRYSSSYPVSASFPIVPADCTVAAQILLCSDSLSVLHFSRQPDRGSKLPFALYHRTCKVKIDILARGDPVETATLLEISTRVLEITRKCVLSRSSRHLGGKSTVGRNNLMEVTVSGVAAEMQESIPEGQCLNISHN